MGLPQPQRQCAHLARSSRVGEQSVESKESSQVKSPVPSAIPGCCNRAAVPAVVFWSPGKEDKRKEELKVEAERTQRQLRNELEGHHLESQILIQQLEVEREGARPVTPIEAQENFSSKSTSVATPVFSVQQRLESSVPAKGALAKINGFFSAHPPGRRPPRKPRRSLDANWIQAPPGWNGSSASLAAPLASSEKKKTSWPQPLTPEIITVPPSPTAPAPPPPRCEASDQNQFLRPPFSGSNENWERTIEQNDGRYAETLGNKAVSQSVSATFLNPLAEGQFKDEARKLRTTLVQEYENVELCHNLVLAACATQEEFNKEFCWFETFTEAHRKMLADINAYLGEGLANLKPAGSIRSRSSRASSRNSAQSKEDKIQEKAWKVAETELRLKQAQEEARLREIEEETIWLLEEDKRKEELKVEAERTQRQLRNELEGHHLESQILIQQLEVERERLESSVPAKEALAKIKGFFSALTPTRTPSPQKGPVQLLLRHHRQDVRQVIKTSFFVSCLVVQMRTGRGP
ncbi:hypothetical protein DAPPUDRAFT_120517 [Daphnia pulex]|uniref:Uncharacterized protein n=1 Tax=Daphnia pulex TaxID=6669 RepID=E9I1M2_DAPPU|nr:hypothetical protein DAPPUDRAFT_120517 [Daphnia pulex]|eukprot:EFX62108.1 hypothetical protein DAPPUDRAFT_120517 [Daphnia pulex]